MKAKFRWSMTKQWPAALLVVVFLAATTGWLSWRFELERLKTPESITEETGLRLPSGVRIIATQAHLFSIADGDNYEWLLQSDTSIQPWATANMNAESGGWEHVRHLRELGSFQDSIPSHATFGGVWKSVRPSSRGPEETSYLYLAEDGRTGILTTFRP